MKNKSIRKIILVILAIIFGLSPIIYNNFNDNDGFRNLEYGNRYNVKRNGYGVLSSIIIDDDDPSMNWMTTAATYDWCSGSGTWNDPYIIENVVIDGQDSSNCLEIRDSIPYFIIRNCTFYNAGPLGKAGILLYNVKNGTLLNLNCSCLFCFWHHTGQIDAQHTIFHFCITNVNIVREANNTGK